MNHLEVADGLQESNRTFFQPEYQKFITSLGVILIAYYVLPYLAYETTFKRTVYDFIINLIPVRFIHTMQSLVMRLRPADGLNFHHNLSNTNDKGQALSQIYRESGLPGVVSTARRFSGYDKIISSPVTEELYRGMNNWDNSCFQNSILQALACLPQFFNYLVRSQQLCNETATDPEVHNNLTTFLEQLNGEIKSRTAVWPPAALKSLNTWQQQDAQEYYSKILDILDKESHKCCKQLIRRACADLGSLRNALSTTGDLSRVERQSEQKLTANIPTNPLEGMLAQTLWCQECGFSEGFTFMPFNCITLNLGLETVGQLEDLLDAYTAPELIDGVECDGCSKEADAKSEEMEKHEVNDTTDTSTKDQIQKRSKIRSTKAKQISFGRLPKDLVFHINRSIFDVYGNQRKNNAPIDFPSRLCIKDKWLAPIGTAADSKYAQGPTYELRCVVTHSGRHDNGHYVACGKRRKNWYIFNDEIVTKTTEEMALARSNVFMLFYEMMEIDYSSGARSNQSHDIVSQDELTEEPDDLTTQEVVSLSEDFPKDNIDES